VEILLTLQHLTKSLWQTRQVRCLGASSGAKTRNHYLIGVVAQIERYEFLLARRLTRRVVQALSANRAGGERNPGPSGPSFSAPVDFCQSFVARHTANNTHTVQNVHLNILLAIRDD